METEGDVHRRFAESPPSGRTVVGGLLTGTALHAPRERVGTRVLIPRAFNCADGFDVAGRRCPPAATRRRPPAGLPYQHALHPPEGPSGSEGSGPMRLRYRAGDR